MFKKLLSLICLMGDLAILTAGIYFYLHPMGIMLTQPWMLFAAYSGATMAMFNLASHLSWLLHCAIVQQTPFDYASFLLPSRYTRSWLRFIITQIAACAIIYYLPYVWDLPFGAWTLSSWWMIPAGLGAIQILWMCVYCINILEPHAEITDHLCNTLFCLTFPVYPLLHPHVLSQLMNFRHWSTTPRNLLHQLGGDFNTPNADGWSGWFVYIAKRNLDVARLFYKERSNNVIGIPMIRYNHAGLEEEGKLNLYQFVSLGKAEMWKKSVGHTRKNGLIGAQQKTTFSKKTNNLWHTTCEAIIPRSRNKRLDGYQPYGDETVNKIQQYTHTHHHWNPDQTFFHGHLYIWSESIQDRKQAGYRDTTQKGGCLTQ